MHVSEAAKLAHFIEKERTSVALVNSYVTNYFTTVASEHL